MPQALQTKMSNSRLDAEFAIGPFRFTNADRFPLEHLTCQTHGDRMSLVLAARFPAASLWRGQSFAVFFMYRFPKGMKAFYDDLERYQADAQESVRLPDRRVFDLSTLAVPGAEDEWDHQCFAKSGRNVFHVYKSKKVAVMIRLCSQKGTMLDHPLLKLVSDNVRLIPGQWKAGAPKITEIAKARSASVSKRLSGARLDLKAEYNAIVQLIKSRIDQFDPKTNYGPGEGQKVSSVQLGFDFVQTGWVAVVFDTRRKSEPDGTWTAYLDNDLLLSRPQWPLCAKRLNEGKSVTLIMRDGTKRALSSDSGSLGETLGTILKDALLDAKKSGVFGPLPKSSSCLIGIEDVLGSFGWPDYGDRKSQGRL